MKATAKNSILLFYGVNHNETEFMERIREELKETDFKNIPILFTEYLNDDIIQIISLANPTEKQYEEIKELIEKAKK